MVVLPGSPTPLRRNGLWASVVSASPPHHRRAPLPPRPERTPPQPPPHPPTNTREETNQTPHPRPRPPPPSTAGAFSRALRCGPVAGLAWIPQRRRRPVILPHPALLHQMVQLHMLQALVARPVPGCDLRLPHVPALSAVAAPYALAVSTDSPHGSTVPAPAAGWEGARGAYGCSPPA